MILASEVNVTAKTAGTEDGMVVLTFRDFKKGEDYDFEVSREQVKWLRTALKQAYELAFK